MYFAAGSFHTKKLCSTFFEIRWISHTRVVLISENFYGNRIVDAWNSLPYTVVSASSINSFKRKLREVNLDRFLTIVE